jgi:hypothetical protein
MTHTDIIIIGDGLSGIELPAIWHVKPDKSYVILKQERKLEAPGACLNTHLYSDSDNLLAIPLRPGMSKVFSDRTFYPEIYINEPLRYQEFEIISSTNGVPNFDTKKNYGR